MRHCQGLSGRPDLEDNKARAFSEAGIAADQRNVWYFVSGFACGNPNGLLPFEFNLNLTFHAVNEDMSGVKVATATTAILASMPSIP